MCIRDSITDVYLTYLMDRKKLQNVTEINLITMLDVWMDMCRNSRQMTDMHHITVAQHRIFKINTLVWMKVSPLFQKYPVDVSALDASVSLGELYQLFVYFFYFRHKSVWDVWDVWDVISVCRNNLRQKKLAKKRPLHPALPERPIHELTNQLPRGTQTVTPRPSHLCS